MARRSGPLGVVARSLPCLKGRFRPAPSTVTRCFHHAASTRPRRPGVSANQRRRSSAK
jgi:hypothetical protein